MNIFAYICIMELLCCTPETNTIINHYYKCSYKATILQKKNRSNHNIPVCACVCGCVYVCVGHGEMRISSII